MGTGHKKAAKLFLLFLRKIKGADSMIESAQVVEKARSGKQTRAGF